MTNVIIQTFLGGTIQVTVDSESYLVSAQDTIANPVICTFPKTIVIPPDPPPLDGVIVRDGVNI